MATQLPNNAGSASVHIVHHTKRAINQITKKQLTSSETGTFGVPGGLGPRGSCLLCLLCNPAYIHYFTVKIQLCQQTKTVNKPLFKAAKTHIIYGHTH